MNFQTGQPPSFLIILRSGVAVALICVLLGFAPFAVALDVHHELAAADADGHAHSDNDLCQWVQHHTAGSINLAAPFFSAWEIITQFDLPPQAVLLSVDCASCRPSRAPPCS